ncbi:MAG: hypothetical protein J5476_00555 [Lachnospiraceae bacterium]|nr:hypothetical protein [Lachnospiraceae bacterium]
MNSNVRKVVLCVSLMMMMTSCTDPSVQEVSRTVRSADIVPYTEETSDSNEKTDPVAVASNESALPRWGGGPEKKPDRFDFDLSFSKDLLVVDYGRTTVNVYRAKYATLLESWGEDWVIYGFGDLADWCRGCDRVIYDEDENRTVLVPEYDTSISNAKNVHLMSLNEIEGAEVISRRLNIPQDSPILCWTYEVKDFPTQYYASIPEFKVPSDINELQYARISSQYVDGIPTYGTTTCHGDCTFDWPNVINSSRIADEGVLDSGRINPSQTFLFEPGRRKLSIETVLQSDIPVVPPETCLDEIKKALMYDPCAVIGNSGILDVWEKSIEVYCMELVYVPLDPCPRNRDESEASHQLHELCLVPAWEVYYVITAPDTNRICSGQILINAVTGKSLFSDEFGPGENTELYPDLLLHG